MLPNALRRRLAQAVCNQVEGMAQVDAAFTLGVSQPDVSRLRNGAIERFSSERLISLLMRLGFDVELRISPARRARAPRPIPTVTVVSTDSLGREATLDGSVAPKARNRSLWSEEIAPE